MGDKGEGIDRGESGGRVWMVARSTEERRGFIGGLGSLLIETLEKVRMLADIEREKGERGGEGGEERGMGEEKRR